MKPVIETDRLLLRELLPEDVEGIFELDADPVVQRYVGGKPLANRAEAANVIDMIRRQYIDNGIGRWAVLEKSTGSFTGWSGLKLIKDVINGHTNYLDLGYRFIPRYWGKGYATETAIAAIHYAFNAMQHNSIFAMADTDNTASNHVLTKVGLDRTGSFMYDHALHNWYELTIDNYRKKYLTEKR